MFIEWDDIAALLDYRVGDCYLELPLIQYLRRIFAGGHILETSGILPSNYWTNFSENLAGS